MHRLILASLLVFLNPVMTVYAAESPHLGEPIDETALADFDYVIMPDGEGLPVGSGDAVKGRQIYQNNCLACHGLEGKNGINDVLVGGRGTLTNELPNKTVGSYWPYATTLFDYIRRAMPYPEPGSLSDDAVYSVTAYLLYLNAIIAETELLTAESLPEVRMPNRDNFVWAYRPN